MEFLLEVEKDLAELYKDILTKCMVEGGNHFLVSNTIKMEVDAKIGKSWADTH
jgi:DNA polymerase I-like protein with 3'-5' exonuclease and polymerase domains